MPSTMKLCLISSFSSYRDISSHHYHGLGRANSRHRCRARPLNLLARGATVCNQRGSPARLTSPYFHSHGLSSHLHPSLILRDTKHARRQAIIRGARCLPNPTSISAPQPYSSIRTRKSRSPISIPTGLPSNPTSRLPGPARSRSSMSQVNCALYGGPMMLVERNAIAVEKLLIPPSPGQSRSERL